MKAAIEKQSQPQTQKSTKNQHLPSQQQAESSENKQRTKDTKDAKDTMEDPFLCVMDECTMDTETGLFSIITEDG